MKEQVLDLIELKGIILKEYSDSHELREVLDYDGSLHEIVDGNIDIYNSALWKWAADNHEYVDQAIDEGLASPSSGIISCLQAGQYVQYNEEMGSILEDILSKS